MNGPVQGMKYEIDTSLGVLSVSGPGGPRQMALYSSEAFEVISDLWVKVGWNEKYPYTFSWLGRPIIQLPEDMVRMQEVIWTLKPDLIIETGVAHGGSLIFYASLFAAMGKGRVVGVDIEIRPHNRTAIEAHQLFGAITLIEGSSTDPAIVATVANNIRPGDKVLIILDSNHTYAHVTDELEAYHALVSPGSYIVATDGVMAELSDTPHGSASWAIDNPKRAAADFATKHQNFRLEQPEWPFNESHLKRTPTHWPGAWLKCIS
jgi:cephalosporin hydroxylase